MPFLRSMRAALVAAFNQDNINIIGDPMANDRSTIFEWMRDPNVMLYWSGMRSENASLRRLEAFAVWLRQHQPDVTMPSQMSTAVLAHYRNALATVLSGGSINVHLSVINMFFQQLTEYGVGPAGGLDIPWAKRKKPKKWWLQPEHEARLINWFYAQGKHDMVDFIHWTIETGLRIEETLRLVPSDFSQDLKSLTVPGTKTDGSVAKLPLSESATLIILRRHTTIHLAGGGKAYTSVRVFDLSYRYVQYNWQAGREFLGVADVSSATLKSLRRVFAAKCLQKGLPERIIQELMRHKSMKTTMEYLHLVGLVDNDATRAMLNRSVPALWCDAAWLADAEPIKGS